MKTMVAVRVVSLAARSNGAAYSAGGMDPVLEVKPSACLLVLGPQVTALLKSGRQFSYDTLLETGVAFLQRHGPPGMGGQSEVAGGVELKDFRMQGCLSSMQKVVKLLKEKGLYSEWLEETLGVSKLHSLDFPDSLQWVLELQQMGALLACTQYDTLLDDLAGVSPATPRSDDPAFLAWLKAGNSGSSANNQEPAMQQKQHQKQHPADRPPLPAELNGNSKCGILHLHGVHTRLESVSLLPYRHRKDNRPGYKERANGSSRVAETCETVLGDHLDDHHLDSLREVFQKKLVLLVGFDGDSSDPLLPSLLRIIYLESDARNLKNPPILLTSSPHNPLSSFSSTELILRLVLPSLENLREIIVPGSSRNFAVGTLLCLMF